MYVDVARECLPGGLAPRPISGRWIITSQDDGYESENSLYRCNYSSLDISGTSQTYRRIPFEEIEPCERPSDRCACQSADCSELHKWYHSTGRLTIMLTILLLIMIVHLCLLFSEKASSTIRHNSIHSQTIVMLNGNESQQS
jgi:hypothetical protein